MCSHPGGYLSITRSRSENILELLEAGVIEGPLQHKDEGTWVSNVVITVKKWDTVEKKKEDPRNCAIHSEAVRDSLRWI